MTSEQSQHLSRRLWQARSSVRRWMRRLAGLPEALLGAIPTPPTPALQPIPVDTRERPPG
jgi:hypothetical protein